MHPISLTIEGLNSFMEPQTVDFEQLACCGFFGIFGNTGSGKSTILDGVTLSLYGTIARDSKSYINTSSEKAKTAFRFSLTEKETCVYLVTREFKRDKESGNARNVSARLIQEQIGYKQQGEVLASGSKAVTIQIEKLLGLTASDFMRTVVLPQGKFSEFLKLTGSERNKMLERLFYLYDYGANLTAKIDAKRTECQQKYDERTGEMKGLEGITKKTVSEEKENLKAKKKESRTEAGHLIEAEKSFLQADEIKKLLQEQEEYRKQEKQISDQREEIKQKEIKLAESKRVQELTGQIRQYQMDQKQYEACRKERERLEEEEGEEREACLQAEQEKVLADTAYQEGKSEDMLQWTAHYLSCLEKMPFYKNQEKPQFLFKVQELKEKRAYFQAESERLLGIKQEQEAAEQEAEKLQIKTAYREQIEEGALLEQKLQERVLEQTGILEQKKELIQGKKALILEQQKLQDKCKEEEKKEETEWKNVESLVALRLQNKLQAGECCPVCGQKVCAEAGFETGLKINLKGRFENKKEASVEDFSKELQRQKKQTEKIKIKLAEITTRLEEREEQLKEIDNNLTKKQAEHETLQAEIEGKRKLAGITSFQMGKEALKKQGLRLEQAEQRKKKLGKQEKALMEQVQVLRQELQGSLWGFQEEFQKQAVDSGKRMQEKSSECAAARGRQEQAYENKGISFSVLVKKLAAERFLQQEFLEGFCQIKKGQLELSEEKKEEGGKILDEATKEAERRFLAPGEAERLEQELLGYRKRESELKGKQDSVEKRLAGRSLQPGEWEEKQTLLSQKKELLSVLQKETAKKEELVKRLEEQLVSRLKLEEEKEKAEHQLAILNELFQLFKGKSFVEYVASERLRYIAVEASGRLMEISNGNYGLEVNEKADFFIRDYKNGGIRREASTLSGGETFLASLSLALALSSDIQLKGTAPLELFFLDEGFGTLDEALLDTVITALERLNHERLKIGFISHVGQLKDRVPVRLMVETAETGLRGSRVRIEKS